MWKTEVCDFELLYLMCSAQACSPLCNTCFPFSLA